MIHDLVDITQHIVARSPNTMTVRNGSRKREETGAKVEAVCGCHGTNRETFYRWQPRDGTTLEVMIRGYEELYEEVLEKYSDAKEGE